MKLSYENSVTFVVSNSLSVKFIITWVQCTMLPFSFKELELSYVEHNIVHPQLILSQF